MSCYISLGVTFEIFFIIFAIFSETRRHVDSLAETYVYSVIFVLSVFSVSIQFFFLFGVIEFYPVVDISLLIISIYLLSRNRKIVFETYLILKEFCVSNPFFSFLIVFFPFLLFLKGFLLPPATTDSLVCHLARVLMMQNDGSYFLENFNDYRLDVMPIGYDCLNFLYLRFYTDYGLATFGFLSYTMTFTGVYALGNKLYADKAISKIISFACSSLPMFLLNAISTKNDLILAAIAIICFLAAFNYIKNRELFHFFFLILSLFFGLSSKITFAAFFIPFMFFYSILVFKKYGIRYFFPHISKSHLMYSPVWLLPVSISFFILNFLGHNFIKYGSVLGPQFYWNALAGENVVIGRALNFVRYFFRAIDLPLEWGGEAFNSIYHFIFGQYSLLGLFPGVDSVQLAGSINTIDVFAWYGLLGMPVIISILFSIFNAKGFIRFLSTVIFIYFLVIVIKLPWASWNGRFFALVFGAGMVCLAFLLKWTEPKFKKISTIMKICIVLIAGTNLLLQVVFLNLNYFPQIKYNVENRNSIYSQIWTEKWFDFFIHSVKPNSRVLLVSITNSPIAPLLLRRPDLDITVTGEYSDDLYRESFKLNGKNYNLLKLDKHEFKTINDNFDNIFIVGCRKTRQYFDLMSNDNKT